MRCGRQIVQKGVTGVWGLAHKARPAEGAPVGHCHWMELKPAHELDHWCPPGILAGFKITQGRCYPFLWPSNMSIRSGCAQKFWHGRTVTMKKGSSLPIPPMLHPSLEGHYQIPECPSPGQTLAPLPTQSWGPRGLPHLLHLYFRWRIIKSCAGMGTHSVPQALRIHSSAYMPGATREPQSQHSALCTKGSQA